MTTHGVAKDIKNGDWWKRRSSLERFLIIFLSIIFVVAVALAISLGLLKSEVAVGDTCMTVGCVRASHQILSLMNVSADPCENFYQFACGKFLEDAEIPEDDISVNSFNRVDNQIAGKLKSLLNKPIDLNEPRPFKLLKKMYSICMNISKIKSDGINPMQEILQTLGGWPVVLGNNWNERDFDWKKTANELGDLGFSDGNMIDIYIATDKKNSSRKTLTIDQPDLGLSRELLVKGREEKVVKAYYDYMVAIAVLFGADKSKALRELKESLEFEIKLANITIPSEERRNDSLEYNPITIRDLQNKYASIPWLQSVNNVLKPFDEVDYDEIVNVEVPKYVKAFEELVRKTPKRTQANYILWRAVLEAIPYLNEEAKRIQQIFGTVASGKSEVTPKWKECVHFASNLRIAIGSLYVRTYFKESAKKNVLNMVDNIKEEYKISLAKSTWMDDITKSRALVKLDKMFVRMAYPDELLDNSKIEEFYQNLEISSVSYLQVRLNLSLFYSEKSIKRFRQPVNKTDWTKASSAIEVNAFSRFRENSIEMPAGILQGFFFDETRPNYVNFGTIGSTIGHEMVHAFDDQGRQYDENGNLVDWWERRTEEEYRTRAKCIIDQYNQFYVPEVDMNVIGNNTIGENIADIGGVRQSYFAYLRWESKNEPELKLPGLNHTAKQLFWIAAAGAECEKIRTEALKLHVLNDVHSPAEFRVLGPLSNSKEFARDFKCSRTSKMNPKHKCQIW